MKIGGFLLSAPLALAPMAGVTDRPFRMLCRRLGAGVAASEMVTSDVTLWHTKKSRLRLDHTGEPEPRIVQIAGGDATMLCTAAQKNADAGAQIIDINMGCPAKKVCNKAAGSALLRDESLVADILTSVVRSVELPVTLKMRTGWDPANRNGVVIARMAEAAGIASLAVHGRTRADHYNGTAEYDTIAMIKDAVTIPVFANGDIDSGPKAQAVLTYTKADGIMIGRAAQGNPWIFREVSHFLETGKQLRPPPHGEVRDIILEHLSALYAFYGESAGVRVARKHLGWYRETTLSTGERIGAASPSDQSAAADGAPAQHETTLFREVRTTEQAGTQIELARAWFDVLAYQSAGLRHTG